MTPSYDDRSTMSHARVGGPGTRPGPSPASVTPLTVALVNDYELVLRGLHAMLSPYPDRVVVVEHDLHSTPDRRCDIALFDTFAGRRDTLSRAREMVAEGLVDHVVLYTWDATDRFIEIARQAGVSGVILKSATGERLVELLERIARGEHIDVVGRSSRQPDVDGEELSMREREVLALLGLGRTNPEIAEELFLSVDTVKTYVRRVFAKLGVNNRTQAALMAASHEVAPPKRRLTPHSSAGARD